MDLPFYFIYAVALLNICYYFILMILILKFLVARNCYAEKPKVFPSNSITRNRQGECTFKSTRWTWEKYIKIHILSNDERPKRLHWTSCRTQKSTYNKGGDKEKRNGECDEWPCFQSLFMYLLIESFYSFMESSQNDSDSLSLFKNRLKWPLKDSFIF